MKKGISLILALLICLYIVPLTVSADFENTYTNTGDKAVDIIEVARTQLGYMEGSLEGTVQGSNDCTKYGEWYGLNYNPWCAMFVSWCADQAGIPATIIPRHASCDAGMNWFINNGRWQYSPAYEGSYTPKASDIVYFGYRGSAGFDSTHVGIVYKVDSNNIYVMEGNSSAKVQTVSYSLTSPYVLGYGCPDYASDGKITYESGEYITTASLLNVRAQPNANSGTAIIGQLSQNSRITVTEIQNEKWGKITLDGQIGWISLAYAARIYTVNYDANGGTESPKAQEKIQNTQLTLGDSVPVRKGYSFLGWSTDASATEAEYRAGGKFYLNCDTTLYAVWKYAGVKYTVSFDAAGGKDAPALITSPELQAVTVPEQIPVRDSHIFTGWALEADSQNVVYQPGDEFVPESDITLYAVWIENDFGITVDSGEGGSFTRMQNSDGSVTLSITSDKNYSISRIVIDGTEQTIISDLKDYSYTFTDLQQHSVEIAFSYNVVKWSNPFTDVAEGKWYYNGVEYCYMNHIMSGTSDTTFSPNTKVTRAMFVTILAKVDGADTSIYTEMSFSDIAQGKWYSSSVEWAYNKGYSSGIGNDSNGKPVFSPSSEITRQEVATFLYTYSSMKGYDTAGKADISGYYDAGRVSAWALDGVRWAVDTGLISGTGTVTLSPRDPATRSAIAVMIMQYVENIVKR